MPFPKLMSKNDTSSGGEVLSHESSYDHYAAQPTSTNVDADTDTKIDRTGDEHFDTFVTKLLKQFNDSSLSKQNISQIGFVKTKEGYNQRQVDETMDILETAATSLFENFESFMQYAALSIISLRTEMEHIDTKYHQGPPPILSATVTESVVPVPSSQTPTVSSSSQSNWSITEIAETLLLTQRLAAEVKQDARNNADQIINEANTVAKKIIEDARAEETKVQDRLEYLKNEVEELQHSSDHWEEILQQRISELDAAYDSFMSETRKQLRNSLTTDTTPALGSGNN